LALLAGFFAAGLRDIFLAAALAGAFLVVAAMAFVARFLAAFFTGFFRGLFLFARGCLA
jgi:hypothetical protein